VFTAAISAVYHKATPPLNIPIVLPALKNIKSNQSQSPPNNTHVKLDTPNTS